MIKEQSFEWLLEGCHRIADVAVAYYPNYAYACSAVKALRRSIAEHACLLKDLTDQGYTCLLYTSPSPRDRPDGPGLYHQDCPPHPRTDRHPPELLGDARPREGYDREKSVSSGL